MRPRLIVAVVAFVLLAALNGFLVYMELRPDPETGVNGIAPAEELQKHTKARTDPLGDLRYTRSERGDNLARMGAPPDLVERVLNRLRRLEDISGGRLGYLFAAADADTVEMVQAFCGRTPDVRPRYGAMRFLIEEDRGLRRAIDLEDTQRLERQPWSQTDRTITVFEELELGDERKDDATLMGLAAILTQKEDDAIERLPPWGTGGLSTWSWSGVLKENPGLEDRMVDYLALMLLAVERSRVDEGLCSN